MDGEATGERGGETPHVAGDIAHGRRPSGDHARGRPGTPWPVWWALAAVVAGIAVGLAAITVGGSPRALVKAPATTATSKPRDAVETPPAHLPQEGMHRVLDLTFHGSTLDTAVFSTCFPWEDGGTGCTNFGNPQEVEWYVPSQISVSGGALHLDAVHEPTSGLTKTGAPLTYRYRSGMVTTYPSFHFTYGYVQWVARLPAGPDLWPALWLLPTSQRSLPEIDMVEGSPNPTRSLIALHPVTGLTWVHAIVTADLASGWHTFGLDWQPDSLTWYVDGKALFTATTNIPDVPMYLLANLAVTNFAPSCLAESVQASCNGSLTIRSIQVWQN